MKFSLIEQTLGLYYTSGSKPISPGTYETGFPRLPRVNVKVKVRVITIALLIHEKTREQQRFTILEVAAD